MKNKEYKYVRIYSKKKKKKIMDLEEWPINCLEQKNTIYKVL